MFDDEAHVAREHAKKLSEHGLEAIPVVVNSNIDKPLNANGSLPEALQTKTGMKHGINGHQQFPEIIAALKPDAVLTDMNMGRWFGDRLADTLHHLSPNTPVAIHTDGIQPTGHVEMVEYPTFSKHEDTAVVAQWFKEQLAMGRGIS